MIHHHRTFGVITVQSAGELVEHLTEHTWTLCTGFSLQGLLFLNDSFSEDGAQEYGAQEYIDLVFLFVPAQGFVGQFLMTFKDYPQRQKADSSNMDAVLQNLQESGGSK